MPDWITHVLVAWTLTTILGFKYKQFSQQNSAIVILGALLPDLYKINIILMIIGVPYLIDFIKTIHLPIGSLFIAGIVSLFFIEKRKIFLFLILGISTHYALDILLYGEGLTMLYPFSPFKWQIGIIYPVNYYITILTIFISIIVYYIYKKSNNTK